MVIRRTVALLFAGAVAAGCANEDGRRGSAAMATVTAFESALRGGDRAELRRLVTEESRQAIEHLPLEAAAGKAALRVVDATVRDGDVLVRVRDPNAGAAESAFVVVKENGELRVDLVATAGLTARERALPGPRERVVSRPLTPAEQAEAEAIARRAAAQPAAAGPR